MLISLKYGYAFFCTPKCASNSIEAMLKPYSDIHLLGSPQVRHTDVCGFDRFVEPYLRHVAPGAEYQRVAVIREPVSWLYSWYRFRSRSALREAGSPNSTAHVSFDEFVGAYLQDDHRPAYADLGSQLEFLTRSDGGVGVDLLYPYENLGHLETYFSAQVGAELSAGSVNVSPRRVYRYPLIEKFAYLRRGLASRISKLRLARLSVRSDLPDPRNEISASVLGRLESKLGPEMELHAEALRTPVTREHRYQVNTNCGPAIDTGSSDRQEQET